MSIIIDILILLLIVFYCRRGARRGVAATIVSIVIFIIAMTGAGHVSREYSGEMTTALNPFLSGVVDSKGAPAAQKRMGLTKKGVSANDMVAEEPALIYDYCATCLEELGISSTTADKLSAIAAQQYVNGSSVKEAVDFTFCKAIAYFIGVIIAFTLIIIFLSVLLELLHLKPKGKLSRENNEYYGAIAGFFKGVVICAGICWVLSFAGVVIGKGTIDGSFICKLLLKLNYLTDIAVA